MTSTHQRGRRSPPRPIMDPGYLVDRHTLSLIVDSAAWKAHISAGPGLETTASAWVLSPWPEYEDARNSPIACRFSSFP